MEAAKNISGSRYISGFVLGNPHEGLMPALYGTAKVEKLHALGVLETFDAATAVMAADTALKTAIVELITLKLARELCGKSYFTITGEVAAVQAAIDRAEAVANESGMFLDSCVVPGPDAKLERFLL